MSSRKPNGLNPLHSGAIALLAVATYRDKHVPLSKERKRIMRNRRRIVLMSTSIIAALSTNAMASLSSGPYTRDFVWQRSADYQQGTVDNLTTGNPNKDATGAPVWQYARIAAGGEGIGSTDPWYARSQTPLVWESYWFGRSDLASWMKGPSKSPRINQTNFTRGQSGGSNARDSAVVDWLNPLSNPSRVDISGTVYINFPSSLNPGAGVSISVAIVRKNASSGSFDLLWSVTKQNPSSSSSSHLSAPVDLANIPVEPDDTLLFTSYTPDAYPFDAYSTIDDSSLKITLVPEPASLALLGLGGLALLPRRRRMC